MLVYPHATIIIQASTQRCRHTHTHTHTLPALCRYYQKKYRPKGISGLALLARPHKLPKVCVCGCVSPCGLMQCTWLHAPSRGHTHTHTPLTHTQMHDELRGQAAGRHGQRRVWGMVTRGVEFRPRSHSPSLSPHSLSQALAPGELHSWPAAEPGAPTVAADQPLPEAGEGEGGQQQGGAAAAAAPHRVGSRQSRGSRQHSRHRGSPIAKQMCHRRARAMGTPMDDDASSGYWPSSAGSIPTRPSGSRALDSGYSGMWPEAESRGVTAEGPMQAPMGPVVEGGGDEEMEEVAGDERVLIEQQLRAGEVEEIGGDEEGGAEQSPPVDNWFSHLQHQLAAAIDANILNPGPPGVVGAAGGAASDFSDYDPASYGEAGETWPGQEGWIGLPVGSASSGQLWSPPAGSDGPIRLQLAVREDKTVGVSIRPTFSRSPRPPPSCVRVKLRVQPDGHVGVSIRPAFTHSPAPTFRYAPVAFQSHTHSNASPSPKFESRPFASCPLMFAFKLKLQAIVSHGLNMNGSPPPPSRRSAVAPAFADSVRVHLAICPDDTVAVALRPALPTAVPTAPTLSSPPYSLHTVYSPPTLGFVGGSPGGIRLFTPPSRIGVIVTPVHTPQAGTMRIQRVDSKQRRTQAATPSTANSHSDAGQSIEEIQVVAYVPPPSAGLSQPLKRAAAAAADAALRLRQLSQKLRLEPLMHANAVTFGAPVTFPATLTAPTPSFHGLGVGPLQGPAFTELQGPHPLTSQQGSPTLQPHKSSPTLHPPTLHSWRSGGLGDESPSLLPLMREASCPALGGSRPPLGGGEQVCGRMA